MHKFVISVLALNRLEATKACLAAVFANSEDYLLVIQNNGSTDGTKEYLTELAKQRPEILVIHNKTNEGFIVPNCRAFEIALGLGIPYFIALNNDTVPPPGWLNWLALPLDMDPNAALSGPGGGCSRLHDNFDGDGGPPFEYVEGACLCAKVALVYKHGPRLFSDYLDFIYGDDSDLSLRMREKGHTIHEANFHLQHTRGETVQTQPEVKKRCNEAQQRNHKVLLKRWAHYIKVRRFDYPIIVRRRYAIGDVLLTTPVIRAIRASNPLSPIFVETDNLNLFKDNPNIVGGATSVTHLGDALVVNLDGAYENRPMMHIVDAYAEAAREVLGGLGRIELRTEFYPSTDALGWAGATRNEFAGPADRVALIHAEDTSWPGKNWPHERFAQIADWLTSMGWRVAVVGKSRPPHLRNYLDLTGHSFDRLGAMMRMSQLFVGNDSFPMNMAMAVGCPTVGIFGVSSSRFIMTNGAPHIGVDADPAIACAGSRHRVAGTTFLPCSPECINSIPVERVQAAVEALLK